MDEIEYGYCGCGCGDKAPIAKTTRKERGQVKGLPVKFIRWHIPSKEKHWRWKGGGKYRRVNLKGRFEWEHRIIAEKALGKKLPDSAVVHHWSEFYGMRGNSCLVVCENQAYHLFLHQRQRAFEACGRAYWLRCPYCKRYDDPGNLYVRKNQSQGWHLTCKLQNETRRKNG
jgi:hypothetical protein